MNSLNFLPLFGTGSDIIKDPKVNILKIFIFNVNFVFFFGLEKQSRKGGDFGRKRLENGPGRQRVRVAPRG